MSLLCRFDSYFCPNDHSFFDFLTSMAETMVGAVLGFILGICALHYQQNRESAAREKAVKEAAIDALNRLMQAAFVNIEALVNTKIQLINDLAGDVETMSNALEKTRSSSRALPKEELEELIEISTNLKYFYKSLPELTVMHPPDFRELSPLSHEMPPLNLFTHRAMSTLIDLNNRLKEHNELIECHSTEMTGEGIRSDRFIYLSSMLTDLGIYICESVEYDLEFFKLVMDQIDEYEKNSGAKGSFLTYEFLPSVLEAFPKDSPVPALRAQLVRFGGKKES